MAPMHLNKLTDMLARKVEQDLADTGNEDFCFALVVFTTDDPPLVSYTFTATHAAVASACARMVDDYRRSLMTPADQSRGVH